MASRKTAQSGTPDEPIQIRPLQLREHDIRIKGLTPLITNPWSEKAKELLRLGQGIGVEPGSPKQKRDPKDPQAEYESRLNAYRLPNGANGFPATAFKGAMVEAARFAKGLTMIEARALFYVTGTEDIQLVTLEGEPKINEAFPRNDTGVVDIRYRPIFHDWGAILRVRFDVELINEVHVLNLINRAGMSVGVGEWRPMSKKSKTGQYGMFEVV